MVQGSFQEEAKEIEKKEAGADDGKHNDETIFGKEGEFEKVTNEGDTESSCHDGNNGKEKAGAEFVERTRNPIDENEINGKGDENRSGGELGSGKFVDVSEGREDGHTDRNCEADWERIFDNIGSKAVFDTVGVFLERQDETWETDTGKV